MNFPSIKAKVNDLIPYARNSRTHSDEQINQICASIKEFGFTNPIIIDEDNNIIAGHGRVMAASKLKIEELPCVQVNGWSEAQKKAYVIADNKLALNAGWDESMLALEFEELKELDFDIELTGFSLDEIGEFSLDVEEVDFPDIPDSEPEYRQMTFTMHNEQVGIVEDAVRKAKKNPLADTGVNKNTNGNAITLICEQWLKQKT